MDGLGTIGTVLVLGGSSELAAAIVAELPLRADATVWLAGRHDPRGSWPTDRHVEHLPWDARDGTDPQQLLRAVTEDLDVVIVAAGVLGDQERAESDPSYAAEVAATNFSGLLPVMLAAGERLRGQGHGSLVVLSSVAGVIPRRANFVYGASKAGLDAAAVGLADALHDTGAHVLVVRPGFVRGRMTEGMAEAPFATTPAEVGKAVAERLRRRPDGILWVPAVLQPMFVALRLLPRSIFRRLPA